MAAASGRLGLAGAGSGGGAGGWAPARGCQGSRHVCLRARGMAPSCLSLGAPAPQSPVQTGKLRLRTGGGTPKVLRQRPSLAPNQPPQQPTGTYETGAVGRAGRGAAAGAEGRWVGHGGPGILGRLEQGLGVCGGQEQLTGLQLRLKVRHKRDPHPQAQHLHLPAQCIQPPAQSGRLHPQLFGCPGHRLHGRGCCFSGLGHRRPARLSHRPQLLQGPAQSLLEGCGQLRARPRDPRHGAGGGLCGGMTPGTMLGTVAPGWPTWALQLVLRAQARAAGLPRPCWPPGPPPASWGCSPNRNLFWAPSGRGPWGEGQPAQAGGPPGLALALQRSQTGSTARLPRC